MKRRITRCFYMLSLVVFIVIVIVSYSNMETSISSYYKRLVITNTVYQNGTLKTERKANLALFSGKHYAQTISSQNNKSYLVETMPHKIFLFSAFAVNYHPVTIMNTHMKDQGSFIPKLEKNYSTIKIIAWTHRNLWESNFYCCLRLHDKTILRNSVYFKINRGFAPKYEVSQFLCSLPEAAVGVAYASLVVRDMKCPENITSYVVPVYPPLKPESGLAVCCKIIYGAVDSRFLVEWFELQRVLGVRKAVFYLYNVTDEALTVLNYYKKLGMAEIFPFDYPMKEKIPRSVEDKEGQVFTDASVTVFDCVERVRRYKYVSIMDIDEIILPSNGSLKGSLPRTLDVIWKRYPKLGAALLKTRFHILEGDASSRESLLTSKYSMCSNAVLDRPKNIYKPLLVQPGSEITHELVAKPGYQWKLLQPDDLVIHHYRRPRNTSLDDGAHLVINYTCPRMAELSALVVQDVQRVQEELGIPHCFDKLTKQCLCIKCEHLPRF